MQRSRESWTDSLSWGVLIALVVVVVTLAAALRFHWWLFFVQ